MFRDKRQEKSGSYEKDNSDTVQLAVGTDNINCLWKGTVKLQNIEVTDSVDVHGLNETLISVGHICDTDCILVFTKEEAVVLHSVSSTLNEDDIETVAKQNPTTKLYEIRNDLLLKACKTTVSDNMNTWQKRLVHINVKVLKFLCENSEDVPQLKGRLEKCHLCIMGKTKKSFDSEFKKTRYLRKVVHSDLCGRLPLSIHG